MESRTDSAPLPPGTLRRAAFRIAFPNVSAALTKHNKRCRFISFRVDLSIALSALTCHITSIGAAITLRRNDIQGE